MGADVPRLSSSVKCTGAMFNLQWCWERRVWLDQCPSGSGITLLGFLSAIPSQHQMIKHVLQCHFNVIQMFNDSNDFFKFMPAIVVLILRDEKSAVCH